ncbi:glycoside hydrolase family protein [Novipirellula artificiosorum]|uniref:hypothetical protein n=1 Tax=Novipirellula artificiosorum TaxID=2528016 RepID=UPI0011B53F02|nr:hypothetical protein [Novipirellula artificiosorum]
MSTSLPIDRRILWKESPTEPTRQTNAEQWRLVQETSGGENWNSRVHLDAHGKAPRVTNGYQVVFESEHFEGQRASPSVGLCSSDAHIQVAVPEFWQKFPNAIHVHGGDIEVQIFPEQEGWIHELQPGEQTTSTLWLELGCGEGDSSSLDWVHQPATAAPTVDCLRNSGGLEWFSPVTSVNDSFCHDLLQDAVEGPRNFFRKRESIDEYGWRNFGDTWADHEEAYATQPKPLISHFNNQYDLLHGLLRQYLLSGDNRWWELASPLARHIIDIDIYHTQLDRSVYNGGLFWHTAHYLDAGTCTHRSMSRTMLGQRHPAGGGGPGNEHNYTTGLLLYYFLTGDQRSKESVLSLADWVIAMDDGSQHLLAPLSSAPTGNASSTSEADFHGPGRGAGNSINALLDAWQLTHDEKYLQKTTELIFRVVHPNDCPQELQLDNAELRWSYTVCLQSLIRYLEIAGTQSHEVNAYVRACLDQYGHWMLENESLYLDAPEQLEFPTETWAAQDLRKGTTLMLIGHSVVGGEEGEKMFARGRDLFGTAWAQLQTFNTRDFTRPLAIALQQLPIFQYASSIGSRLQTSEGTTSSSSWQPKQIFRSQKQRIREQLRSPRDMVTMLGQALRPRPWIRSFRQTSLATRLNRYFSR